MGAFIDMTGKKYGRLTVLGRTGTDSIGNAKWQCVCDCGSEHTTSGVSLRQGRVVSCGCYQSEVAKATAVANTEPLTVRLLRYVKTSGESECWEWTGSKNEQGYGLIRWNRKSGYAHRMAYEAYNGPIKRGMVIMHSCDNPSCVNPQHLSQGTATENMRDMVRKGRNKTKRGEDNANARLSNEQVIQIRELLSQGKSLNETSILFGVSKKTVLDIKQNKIWKHVHPLIHRSRPMLDQQ